MVNPLRGEVWLASLDPTVGSEIQKTRPCVIVSPDELNTGLRTVIVAPMTTGSRPAPFRGAVRFKGKDGLILPDQLRTLDKTRLVKRLGKVERDRADAARLAALHAALDEGEVSGPSLRSIAQIMADAKVRHTPTTSA